MTQLTENFSRVEFACKCGCGYDTVDYALLRLLEVIRNHFNASVSITSGCRCAEHNRAVGGSDNSQHKKGRAADITVSGVSPSKVADFASTLGLSVGRYNTFTHVDTRSGPAKGWSGS